jgi:hypothetical protein
MRYRALSPTGDFQFGRSGIFLVNNAAVVVQAIRTRLMLWTGEWFLDNREGTPYKELILGYGTQGTRDLAVKERILSTPGVLELTDYSSSVSALRKMTVAATVKTIYGSSTFSVQV